MQVDHVRNDFVHIPFSTSVQEGGSFSVAEGVNFGSPALSMKSADFRPGTTENSLEKEDRCAGWRPRIIESAGEPKSTPSATLKLPPSWTLVEEGMWTKSFRTWSTCMTRRRAKRI